MAAVIHGHLGGILLSDDVIKLWLIVGAIFVLAAAGGEAVLRWGPVHVPPIRANIWRVLVVAVGVLSFAVAGIGSFSTPDKGLGPVVSLQSATGTSAAPIPTSASSPPTAPTSTVATPDAAPTTSTTTTTDPVPTSGFGSVARQGTLNVRAFVAVDLDSTAADWGARQGTWADGRDFEWDGGPTDLMINGAPGTTAVLGSAAPSDFTACTTARMGVWPAADKGLYVGQRFCVQTGAHMVLLDVKAMKQSVNGSPAMLTMNAIVWNES